MTSNKVKLSEIMAPSFYSVHKAVKSGKYSHYMLKGGRGSCKSSFVSIEFILGIVKHPDANGVVIRKVGLYLRDSVYEQLIWAIGVLGMSNMWEIRKAPLELVYIPTGQKILFRGADKPRKLKSTKVSKGYIRYIWYEELDEFTNIEEIDTINQSFMRGGSKFDIFYSFNPPKSPRNWVNTEVKIPKDRRLVHHSDYRTVPVDWLGEQFIAEAEHLKKINPLRYENEYLGEETGTGAEIFPNVIIREIADEEIASFDRIYRGLDWGYGADPFAYVAMNYDSTTTTLYIYHEFYKFGAKYDEISKAIKAENKSNGFVTAESAEPRSNDELRERGLKILKAKKGQGSVDHGISWLQNRAQIIIDPIRCPNAAREFNNYSLIPDNQGGFRSEYPDKDNHTIDATRYALESVIGRKTIKTIDKSKLGIY
jgi:PBSX family phage terminase large subunit